jgi:hypothetical protein
MTPYMYQHTTTGETSMPDEEKNSIYYYKIQHFRGRHLRIPDCYTCILMPNKFSLDVLRFRK